MKKNPKLTIVLLIVILFWLALILNSCNKKNDNQAVYYQNCRADSIELIISGVNTIDMRAGQIINYESSLPQIGVLGIVSSIKDKKLTHLYNFTIGSTNLIK
jgi:hypothetical protein